MTKRVTLANIAEALNLSVSTVGLALSTSSSPLRERLSKQTVSRIQEKAQEMGYLPNRAAQTMRKGRTNLVVFLNLSGDSEIGAKRAYHVGRLVHQAGFDYQTVNAYWWPGDGRRLVEQVIALRPEGIIASGHPQSPMDFESFRRAGIPVVSIGFERAGLPWVRYDARQAICELTLSCLNAGRTRPALLMRTPPDNERNWQMAEREMGFVDALKIAGMPPPSEFTSAQPLHQPENHGVILRDWHRSVHFEPFAPGIAFAEWLGDVPDALICTNDAYAASVLTYYLRRGTRVPEQVAISGFDNCAYTTLGTVSLTTVEQPTAELCEAAMEMLIARMGGTSLNDQARVFPCEIIWRESMPNSLSVTSAPSSASIPSKN